MISAKCNKLYSKKDKNAKTLLSSYKINNSKFKNSSKISPKPSAMYIFTHIQKVNEGLYNTLQAANKIRA